MPNVNVYDMSGKVVGDIALSDAVFGIEPNGVVMHAAVVNYWPTSARAPSPL